MFNAKQNRLKRDLLKIGEVAEQAGVLPSTIAYYEGLGLIEAADYTRGKYRLFKGDETVKKLKSIKALQAKGLYLKEIQNLLSQEG